MILAIVVPIAVAVVGCCLRPVRVRVVALWRRVAGRPRSRLRIAHPGPFPHFWGWYADAKGARRVTWQGVLLVTNDGERVNAVVNGSIIPTQRALRSKGIRATFGPPPMSLGSGAGVYELRGDQCGRIFLHTFMPEPIVDKPHSGPMKCRIQLNDRYGRRYSVRLTFPEAEMPNDQAAASQRSTR